MPPVNRTGWCRCRFHNPFTMNTGSACRAVMQIINEAVLLPVYDDPADCIAQQALATCFPEREIIPVNCLPLIRQYGSLHCATMQLPAGVLPATGG